jgi:hypothetical protein
MAVRQGHHQRVPHRHVDLDPRGDDVPAPERDVGVALLEPLHRRLGVLLAGQLELDAGMPRAHGSGQPGHQTVGGHAGEGHPHHAHPALIGRPCCGLGAAQSVEDLPRRPD